MRTQSHRSGQALLMVTVSLFLMFGLLSLGVDLGWAYFYRESAQTAADATAAAVVKAALIDSPSSQVCGTNKVWCGSPAGTITSCPAVAVTSASTSFDNGCMLASANGFTTAGTQTVTIQANTTSSPPTVSGITTAYWATVRISQNAPTFFGFSSVGSALTASARATVAVISSGSATGNPCLYILSPTGTSFNIGNGAHVTTSSCGVYVDSSSSGAMTVTGGATVTSSLIQVVGTVNTNNGGSTSSTPQTGAAVKADPFINLPSPTAGTCNTGNFTSGGTSYNVSPATYCNGFSVSNGANATLSSGTYIVSGGTFSIQGGSTLTATSGVMIYLTNGATVSIANGATVNMTAESSGTYQGILFYQDRTMTSPAASSFAGGANMHLSGSLYFPNSLLNIDNGSNAQTEAVVAGSVNFQGGATFNQATSSSQTGLSVGGTSTVSVIE